MNIVFPLTQKSVRLSLHHTSTLVLSYELRYE